MNELETELLQTAQSIVATHRSLMAKIDALHIVVAALIETHPAPAALVSAIQRLHQEFPQLELADHGLTKDMLDSLRTYARQSDEPPHGGA